MRMNHLIGWTAAAIVGSCAVMALANCASRAPAAEQPARAEAAPDSAAVATVRRELEATFAERARAFEAEDYAVLVNQISSSFTAVRPDGSTMSRDDVAQYIRRNLDRWVRITRQSNVIESLRLEGNSAVLDMRQDLARIQIVDGREALVESSVLQTETWTRTSDGWKLLSVRNERDQRLAVDGQPVQ